MDFKELVRGFINSEVEVMTPGDMITGTLISVNDASLMLKVPPVMYGPPGDVAIVPLRSVEFVRVLTD
ncbi:hypothetical protein BK138_08325 [Paenibacillus rhizosphaerae]|jgi:hypothetical protein|uniref:Uncharacterized protein n=2 Tax=Paenibacillus TaxID=44249 RepID=A0A1R1F399_9BACL|nr:MULTISPECIES: hypothetical protein [Paenibacillus]OMF58510.1 hypothetical protein BK138_08325 [Paenibacillus rhizosphaerae]OXL82759.1 hypothetical protein BCV73_06395 [Paenibacillus sp. SSG-1]UYO03660.1 hypothetical protein K2F33_29040 [Paenibacillus sp. PSB04]GIO53123.1 hypothetical protein J21TS7_14410 [Paenibacillus cineris]